MVPTLRHFGVGCIPWSPIARGFLARPADTTTKTTRQETDAASARFVNSSSEASKEINKRVEKVATDLGKSMAQVAYAWCIQQPYVDAPIIGSTKMEHLVEAIGTLESVSRTILDLAEAFYRAESINVKLSDEQLKYISEPYVSQAIRGHE